MKAKEITDDNYCIEKCVRRCSVCACSFVEYIPSDYELTCFDGEDGSRYFLPVYGRHGYLELLERLLPERKGNEPVFLNTVTEFLCRLSEKAPVRLCFPSQPPCCPYCGSNETICEQRTTLHNHPVLWVSVDEEFLDDN